MRRLTRNIAFCIAVSAVAATSHGAETIRWETDLEAAFQKAQATNRPLLLHFWTPDCAPCRRLEHTVFNQPRVAGAVHDHFVPVKIDANQHPRLADRYGVKSVPNDVIVTPGDQELHRMFSPQDPEQYVAQLSAVAFRAGSLKSQERTARRPGPLPGGVPTSEERWAQYARESATASHQNPDSTYSRGPYAAASTDLPPEERSGPTTQRPSPPQEEPREVINRFARREQAEFGRKTPQSPNATTEAPDRSDDSRWGAGRIDRHKTDPRRHNSPRITTGIRWTQSRRRTDTPPNRQADAPGTPRHRAPTGPEGRVATSKKASTPLGMDGYCPVSLIRKNSWTKGDPRFGVIHRGRTYLFAGPEEKEIFYADPDEYSPVLSGIDPVELATGGTATDGQRAHGVVYRKRVYLFSTEQNLQSFWEEPERYASPIRQAMETGNVGRLFR